MVCSLESTRMAALKRLQAVGNVSQSVTEKVGHQILAAPHTRRELREADEANLLDEEDMNIFGLRPMTDPLDLVCCNNCKKPIRTSQYTAHAELCKFQNLRTNIIPAPVEAAATKKKPPRKERKKLPIAHANQVTTLKEPKKFESVAVTSVAADVVKASEYFVNGQIQITPLAEAKRVTAPRETLKINGPIVGTNKCSGNALSCPSKPFKRAAYENLLIPCTKSLCMTTKVHPYVPAPLATKIYYSQRNHHLRRSICHMFYGEQRKNSSCDASHSEVAQVNAVPIKTSTQDNFDHEQIINQQRKDHFIHPAQKPDQILSASSELLMDKAEGFVPSKNVASQLPVDNTLAPHYISSTYSSAGKTGKPVGPIKRGGGSVPVV